MFDRKVIRRRRAALGLLVLLSLLLLTFSFGEAAGGGFSLIRRGAQEILAPIETGASRALKPIRDLIGWTDDVLTAEGENDRLVKEVERLRQELARAQTDQREAEQLRGLVGLSRREGFPDDVEPITARVIARSPTVWHSSLQINRGTDDGVEVDQPVIASGGLVGKVTAVTDGTARVTLITDESSAVSAQVVPAGITGVVKPEVGRPDDLLLDFIRRGRRLRRGDTVVTSGSVSSEFESIFPRGIPVGKIRRAEQDEIKLYQRVHIEPFADLRRMEFVQVLRPRERSERAEVSAP